MPNCFQLIPVGEESPAILQKVDDRIWTEVFQEEPNPEHYCKGWFDIIGFAIATGTPLNSPKMTEKITNWWGDINAIETAGETTETIAYYKKKVDNMLKILTFLRANYTDNAWAQIGK